ncbi:MAG: hypothetical protein KGO53_04460 [Alphaproteobacteria bacterium]|nr:hypothetical protein [Alphaproteobacteria bacterium]
MSRTDDSLIIRNADLDAAVKAGALDEATAARLVRFVAAGSVAVNADEEQLRLVTGFNDIFVAIGLGLFLGALFAIAKSAALFLLPPVCWGLAELFTRRMRLALPSIILLVVFVGSVFFAVLHVTAAPAQAGGQWFGDPNPWGTVLAAALAALAAALHWRRFHVPITVAAGAASVAGLVVAALGAASPDLLKSIGSLIALPMGLGVFALAMFFDGKDRARRTQMSDRAFWLHLLAAPLIVHPLVWNMTNVAGLTALGAGLIVAMFVVLAGVALLVDRRALLVSSLTYLGYALSTFFGQKAFGTEGAGLAVLAVGAIVLLLSVFWKPLRRALLATAPPQLQILVPPVS